MAETECIWRAWVTQKLLLIGFVQIPSARVDMEANERDIATRQTSHGLATGGLPVVDLWIAWFYYTPGFCQCRGSVAYKFPGLDVTHKTGST